MKLLWCFIVLSHARTVQCEWIFLLNMNNVLHLDLSLELQKAR